MGRITKGLRAKPGWRQCSTTGCSRSVEFGATCDRCTPPIVDAAVANAAERIVAEAERNQPAVTIVMNPLNPPLAMRVRERDWHPATLAAAPWLRD